jgi:predicted HicB family RNase H-like nuclease
MFKYGNYIAKPEVDAEAGILHGRILNISDVVCFEGRTVKEAEQDFQRAVDAYIASCREKGKEPAKPFSGKLPFRTTPEIHRDIYIASTRVDKSINAWMEEVLSLAARQHNQPPNVAPEKQEGLTISFVEYERLLAQLQNKLLQLQDVIRPYLEEKTDGSLTRLFRDMKPFLKDRELPELFSKVETIQERLKSMQYEASFLAIMDQVPATVPVSEHSSTSNSASSQVADPPTSEGKSYSSSVLPIMPSAKVDILS